MPLFLVFLFIYGLIFLSSKDFCDFCFLLFWAFSCFSFVAVFWFWSLSYLNKVNNSFIYRRDLTFLSSRKSAQTLYICLSLSNCNKSYGVDVNG